MHVINISEECVEFFMEPTIEFIECLPVYHNTGSPSIFTLDDPLRKMASRNNADDG